MGNTDRLRWHSDLVPNLVFYAADDDWPTVVRAVFESGVFRVFEADSAPGSQLQEFSAAADVPDSRQGRSLMLFVSESGPEPLARRIDLEPDGSDAADFRYTCEGWGLIQLDYGGPWRGGLRWSRTNHNTAKRAGAWAATYPELGDPADWDWSAVTKASSRLNRAIRRLAVDTIGSRPVLPHAAELMARGGLRHEHGMGIHATEVGGGG